MRHSNAYARLNQRFDRLNLRVQALVPAPELTLGQRLTQLLLQPKLLLELSDLVFAKGGEYWDNLDVGEPIRPDLRFSTRTAESQADRVPPTALVHGLARGGSHVALVLRAWGEGSKAAA